MFSSETRRCREAPAIELNFEHKGAILTIHADRSPDGWRLLLPDGRAFDATEVIVDGSEVTFSLKADGDAPESARIARVPYTASDDAIALSWRGGSYSLVRVEPGAARETAVGARGDVVSPTGGVIAELSVVPGQTVEAFQQIAVIEAMKVMTAVEAPIAGTISDLLVARGERVEPGAPIARIAPANETFADVGDDG